MEIISVPRSRGPHPHRRRAAVGLTIAGSDSGGGAGIQADLKTFSALGVYGTSVITAVTAQNTRAVSGVHEVPAQFVSAQLDAVLDDIAVDAIKIGMLASAPLIDAVAAGLAAYQVPVVLDPVMVAKSGDMLLQPDAVETLRTTLLPLATLLTPNLPEAACLLNTAPAGTEAEAIAQGEALLAAGPGAVLMKGGHAKGAVCVDLLITLDQPVHRLEAPRVDTRNTHGTGCTLSAAVAAGLAFGKPLHTAVGEAHAYLQGAIAVAEQLGIGSGHGPVHHFHRQWG